MASVLNKYNSEPDKPTGILSKYTEAPAQEGLLSKYSSLPSVRVPQSLGGLGEPAIPSFDEVKSLLTWTPPAPIDNQDVNDPLRARLAATAPPMPIPTSREEALQPMVPELLAYGALGPALGLAGKVAKPAVSLFGEALARTAGKVLTPEAQMLLDTGAQAVKDVAAEGIPGYAPRAFKTPGVSEIIKEPFYPKYAAPKIASTAQDLLAGKTPVEGGVAPSPKAALDYVNKVQFLKEDLTKTTGKLETALNHIEDIAKSGTYQPKEIRPLVAKGAPASQESLVSRYVVQESNKLFVDAAREVKRLRQASESVADDFTTQQLKLAEDRLNIAFAKRQEAARTASESLKEFDNPSLTDVSDILSELRGIKDIQPKLAVADEILVSILESVKPGAGEAFAKKRLGTSTIPETATFRTGAGASRQGKNLFNYARINLFPILSFARDLITNATTTAVRLPGKLVNDAYSIGRGETPNEIAAIGSAFKQYAGSKLNAIMNRSPKSILKLPEQVELALGNDVRDLSAAHVTNLRLGNFPLDYVAAPALRLKVGADRLFSRPMAMAELIARGGTQANLRGLKGTARESFIDKFIENPPPDAIEAAILIGKRHKFGVDLSKAEKAIANNFVVQAALDTFPRWSFQLFRWGARTLGADPIFWKKITSGQATPREAIDYLTTAASGWGGIKLFNDVFYDNVDPQTMEYVNDKKERTRLSGLTPIPEAFAISALMRGDTDSFYQALPFVSAPFASVIGGDPSGFFSELLKSTQMLARGTLTEARFNQDTSAALKRLIPGQALWSAIKGLSDPKLRQGIFGEVPILSRYREPVINMATGEPIESKQKVFGMTFPSASGTAIPGGTRVQPRLEREILDHELGLYRSRRTPIADFPASGVPLYLQQRYERAFGRSMAELGNSLIESSDWTKLEDIQNNEDLPIEERIHAYNLKRERLQKLINVSKKLAVSSIEKETGQIYKRIETPTDVVTAPARVRLGRQRTQVLTAPR